MRYFLHVRIFARVFYAHVIFCAHAFLHARFFCVRIFAYTFCVRAISMRVGILFMYFFASTHFAYALSACAFHCAHAN